MEHLLILNNSDLPLVLAKLLNSSIKENKEIAKECIRLFLIDPKTNSGFFFPKSIQNQCATIVLTFCGLFKEAADEDGQQLYYSCRATLVSILKSIAFSNRTRCFGIADKSHLTVGLYKFAHELADAKLRINLESIYESPSSLSTTDFRKKGLSLPVNVEDLEDPCYLAEVFMFHCDFSILVNNIKLVLTCLREAIWVAGSKLEFNTGWSLFLSILKELHNISKLYGDGKELLSEAFREFPLAINYLIVHSKRGDDHLWLLKYDSALDFEARRHLMGMMFPEVKDDKKLHKLIIDRTLLLKESFEHIAHVKPKSLHNGLSVEFKDEVATGHGVLREWLFLVCQALFRPENSLFVECPEDRHRFFPNPAQLKPEQLDLFRFCGRVIALAVMHQVQVGIAFDHVFFLQLAEEKISLDDIQCADPIMYRSCKKILEMDADLVDSDAMGLTFVREIEEFGSRKTVELCPGGSSIVVNSKNREQYVHLLIQHIFVKSISAKVAYFARGFADILCKRKLAKSFFRGIDLKGLDCVLLGGDKPICLKDWKAHTKYEGYRGTDEHICWFWKVVEGMSMEQQRELLFFWTSVKYLPLNGFSGLPYYLSIYKTPCSDERLPSSHTCAYGLSLPHYSSLAIMQQHLTFICQRHVGCSFGFV
ncbi:hypothetical protein MKW94_006792 [Papaver nudicaule]|uniref:HECT-type E3 ubiquitin transferase n=1 Tax=Papaver nudicaule TaxID=74823 RepID=A0AA41SJM9_PAPNU|nr:hypothetical protein [Papaver nudicaule]